MTQIESGRRMGRRDRPPSRTSRLARALAFVAVDRLPRDRHDISVCLRHRRLGDDATPLLAELCRGDVARRIHVIVEDANWFREANEHVLSQLEPLAPVFVVDEGSRAARDALRSSFVVFITDPAQLVVERLLGNRRARVYVRLYHGLITKAYGRLRPRPDHGVKAWLARRVWMAKATAGMSLHGVSSEVEAFFRASAEGADPNNFLITGYPRMTRAMHLRSFPEENWLTPAARRTLEPGQLRILYAPTHKDGLTQTTFFPFDDFDGERLRQFLRRRGWVLHLRLHPREEISGRADDLIDGETVRHLSSDLVPSLTEALSFFDAVITDYSSTYLDFVLLDRPVFFVRDAWESFAAHRGLAFDEQRYFPGPRIQDMKGLLEALATLGNGADPFRAQRRFVRDVLMPAPPNSYLDVVLSSPAVAGLAASVPAARPERGTGAPVPPAASAV